MDDTKIRLVTSILHFLRNEYRRGELPDENKEGMELAIQCLELVYNIKETEETEPNLLEIYNKYLLPTILDTPDLTEEQIKEAEDYKNKGNAAMNDGLFKNALELYSKAIKIAPKNAVYYCNRAAAYSKLEDHKSAIDDCNLALRIDPNYSKAYGRLGLAYYGLGNYEKSVEYYRKAIQLVPDNEAFKNNYELALTKINKQKNEASTSTSISDNENQFFRNLNTILNNPEMMNIATQMFSNPAMQSTMLNVFSRRFNTNRTNDMDDIQNIGQSIAQDIYAENPQSMADLIDSVSRSPLQTLINQGEATQAPNTTTDNNAEVSTLIDTETQQSNENNDENKE